MKATCYVYVLRLRSLLLNSPVQIENVHVMRGRRRRIWQRERARPTYFYVMWWAGQDVSAVQLVGDTRCVKKVQGGGT